VQSLVFGAGEDDEVVWFVVEWVAIDVVDDLARQEPPAPLSFRDRAVLGNLGLVNVPVAVATLDPAVAADKAAAASRAAGGATPRCRPGPTPWTSTNRPIDHHNPSGSLNFSVS
jgi:hypothetical protein